MKKLFVNLMYLICICSFIMLCSDSESAVTFLLIHFIACITFVLSALAIYKLDK